MCNGIIVVVLMGLGGYLLDRALNWWVWRHTRDDDFWERHRNEVWERHLED